MNRFLIALLGCLLVAPAMAAPKVDVDGSGRIEKPGQCSPKIGDGGNYIQGSLRLAGKCENGGERPRLAKDPDGNRYLSFTSTRATAQNNTRTGLPLGIRSRKRIVVGLSNGR